MHAWAVVCLLKLVPWAKRLLTLGLLGALVYGSLYLKLGELTFAEHAKRIWQTPEAIDLREGVAGKLAGARGAALEELKTRLAATRTGD
jgi:hypothetical protein